MLRLPHALRAWPSPAFSQTLKNEIEALSTGTLPLEKALNPGSYVGEEPLTVTVLQTSDVGDAIEAKLGVFFTEIVASCGCGAEPMEQNAYCLLRLRIAKDTAAAAFALVEE